MNRFKDAQKNEILHKLCLVGNWIIHEKYGFGYKLFNGNYGFLYKDKSKMI